VDDKPFTVRIVARGYEVDPNGHVAGTVLLQYGQHARWECMRAAGVHQADLAAREIGPVSLEERIRFHHEIRAGQEVAVRASSPGATESPSALSRRSACLTGRSPPKSPMSAGFST
jgi:acyl-CoA thioesterase FadM